MVFPDNFPPSCPPNEAVPTLGVVYHLVRQPLDDERNFQPLAKRDPRKVNECRAHGLSVLRSKEAALTMAKLSLFRNRSETFVAAATLTIDRGKIAKTGRNPHHYTWWVAQAIPAQSGFSIVDQGEQHD